MGLGYGHLPSNTRLGPSSFTDERGPGRSHATSLTSSGAWTAAFSWDRDESGAVDEAYSDIVGEAVGFFHEDNGATADYLQGSDQSFGPTPLANRPRGSLSILEDVPPSLSGRLRRAATSSPSTEPPSRPTPTRRTATRRTATRRTADCDGRRRGGRRRGATGVLGLVGLRVRGRPVRLLAPRDPATAGSTGTRRS